MGWHEKGKRERQTQAGLSEEGPEVQLRHRVTASWSSEEVKNTDLACFLAPLTDTSPSPQPLPDCPATLSSPGTQGQTP